MALGSTSRIVALTSPVVSSLLEKLLVSTRQHFGDAPSDLVGTADAVDAPKQPASFVVRQQGCRHRLVLVEALLNRRLLVVGSMNELGVRGRRTIL